MDVVVNAQVMGAAPNAPRVCGLDQGEADLRLLGSKAAGLREMTMLGLPVPDGFTVTSEAFGSLLPAGALPIGLMADIEPHLRRLEAGAGRTFGDPHDPLLVSVRPGDGKSGAGLMETILNIGLNDQSVRGLAARVGDEHFAFSCYSRLIADYLVQVLGLPSEVVDDARDRAGEHSALPSDSAGQYDRNLIRELKDSVLSAAGREFPQDPRAQLHAALAAAMASCRRRAREAGVEADDGGDDGVSITVMEMVFANAPSPSGSGLVFRRAAAGPGQLDSDKLLGAFLPGVQGDELLAPYRRSGGVDLASQLPHQVVAQLEGAVQTLAHADLPFRELEFTVESGRLWLLQLHLDDGSVDVGSTE